MFYVEIPPKNGLLIVGNNTRKTLKHVVEICDIVVMLLCFGLATIAVSHAFSDLSLKDFLSMRVKIQNILLFSGFVYIWNMVLSSFGMYESRRLSPVTEMRPWILSRRLRLRPL